MTGRHEILLRQMLMLCGLDNWARTADRARHTWLACEQVTVPDLVLPAH